MVKELYVSCDVEADGPIPGPYSMLSLGMSVVGRPDLTFYVELKPISEAFDPKAMEVNGLDREHLKVAGLAPEVAMAMAEGWLRNVELEGERDLKEPVRCVFLAAPAVWDGMFIHWYFIRFLKRNPFGVTGSGIDLRSYWMGAEFTDWSNTGKKDILKKIKIKKPSHTHRADEDAAEQAAYFQGVLEYQERKSFLQAETTKVTAEASASAKRATEHLDKLQKQLEKYKNRVFVGVAVVVRRNGKIVLGKRKGSHGEGQWSLPGGGHEKNETLVDAAARELREETNIVVPSSSLKLVTFGESYHPDYNSRWVTVFFETAVRDGVEPENAEPNKCYGWEWFSSNALPAPLFAAFQVIIDQGLL